MGLLLLLAFAAVLVIYLSVAGYSIHWLRKRNKPKYMVWTAVAFWVLLPTWDTIISLSYHRYVCATAPDIGLTVYQTVPLDPKLFDEKTGKPMIFDKYGNVDREKFGDRFKSIWDFHIQGYWPFIVRRGEVGFYDAEKNLKISSFIDYFPQGGLWWWDTLFGRMFDSPGFSVPACIGKKQKGELIDEMKLTPFVKAGNPNIGGHDGY